VIDVAGKVNKPGVYKLPTGSRAVDALKAAGGARKGVDLSDINLAHVLNDGEQIIVGAPKVITTTSKRGKSSSKTKISGPININTATADQLDSLPGVGPVMAGRIITYRQKNGPFKVIEDLRKVAGMGASKFAALQSQIRI
jgi:competence protein ComEA